MKDDILKNSLTPLGKKIIKLVKNYIENEGYVTITDIVKDLKTSRITANTWMSILIGSKIVRVKKAGRTKLFVKGDRWLLINRLL